MHRFKHIFPAFGLLFLLAPTAYPFECNVCHSKKPEMVRMHKALQSRKDVGCFDCHRVGENLMGKGQPKDPESVLKRRATEEICKSCHKGS